jgi:hypothetical protein
MASVLRFRRAVAAWPSSSSRGYLRSTPPVSSSSFPRILLFSSCRSFSTPSSGDSKPSANSAGGLLTWWRTFKREFKEEIRPLPDPPGYTPTTLINPKAWEKMPSSHVRYAFKLAVRQSVDDWKWLLGARWSSNKSSDVREEPGQHSQSQQHQPTTLRDATAAAARVAASKAPTAEDIGSTSLAAARRIVELSRDESFRAKVTAASADALRTARDCLDEFLAGYAEGKNAEILAYIEEQMEKEKDFVERVKTIRMQLDHQHQQATAADASGAAAAAAGSVASAETKPASSGA